MTDLQQAERASRVRSALMATMAVVLIINAFIAPGESSTMTPALRHGIWAAMIVLWLIILATGGWLQMARSVRSLMNDEVAMANRAQALQTGFWAASVGGIALYFASLEWTVSAHVAIRILVDVTVAAAMLRYAWLELR